VLAPHHYREFSLRYLRKVAQGLARGEGFERTPLILFGKGNAPYLEELADTGAEALGVDWLITLDEARRRTAGHVALQGNVDPATLYGSPESIRAEVQRALASFGEGPGHVFNLGHGLSPDMDPDNVRVMVDAVHEFSRNRA
jgi:uroporphyrinogen decarboxylase